MKLSQQEALKPCKIYQYTTDSHQNIINVKQSYEARRRKMIYLFDLAATISL